MTSDPATRRRDAAHHQALRFLLVGATTVAIDFVAYTILHAVGLSLTPAKTCSFIVATVCAYVLNRSFTFDARGGRRAALLFVALYACTLVVNVTTNAVGLEVLDGHVDDAVRIVAAFLVAQVISSTLNFLGMRYVVFNERSGA